MGSLREKGNFSLSAPTIRKTNSTIFWFAIIKPPPKVIATASKPRLGGKRAQFSRYLSAQQVPLPVNYYVR
jgi:hypothetical protein